MPTKVLGRPHWIKKGRINLCLLTIQNYLQYTSLFSRADTAGHQSCQVNHNINCRVHRKVITQNFQVNVVTVFEFHEDMGVWTCTVSSYKSRGEYFEVSWWQVPAYKLTDWRFNDNKCAWVCVWLSFVYCTNEKWLSITYTWHFFWIPLIMKIRLLHLGPLLLTWINFNPSMDK